MREQLVGAGSPVRRVRWSRHVAPLAVALTALLAAPALAEPGKSRGHSKAAPGKAVRPAPKSPPPRRTEAPKPKPAKPKPKSRVKKPAPPQSRRPAQTPSRGRSQTAPHGRNAQGNGPTRRFAPATPGGNSQGHRAEKRKVTICHATGSSTNPYVQITISRNALPAHTRHQDGRDIVPAPAGGCPGSEGSGPAATHGKPGKVTLCHATGSETNPYVLITVSESALKAHLRHQNGEDILNPTGPCPGTPGESLAGWIPVLTTLVGIPPASGEAVVPPLAAGVLGDRAESKDVAGTKAEGADAGEVKGVTASSGDPEDDSLPFTGLNVALLALAGIAALLTGLAVRSAVRPS